MLIFHDLSISLGDPKRILKRIPEKLREINSVHGACGIDLNPFQQ